MLLGFLDSLPSSYRSQYRRETVKRTPPFTAEAPLVTEADLLRLPEPVRAYLRYTGSVGRPRVRDFHARFRGQIRTKPDGSWLNFRADQHNFYEPRARLFLIDASQFGVPFTALHRYVDSAATMQVKVASLFRVVDAKGPEMNISETVTMLNDMCILAPATLIDEAVTWQALGPRAARATFSNAGNTVSATLSFGADGELVNFESEDRYQTSDGKQYARYRWSTPVRDYRDFDGRRLAAHGEASWTMPKGELVYGRFELIEIHFNLSVRGKASGPS